MTLKDSGADRPAAGLPPDKTSAEARQFHHYPLDQLAGFMSDDVAEVVRRRATVEWQRRQMLATLDATAAAKANAQAALQSAKIARLGVWIALAAACASAIAAGASLMQVLPSASPPPAVQRPVLPEVPRNG